MKQKLHCYVSYLLRLWFVRTESGWRWRASLESPVSGESKRFDDLDSMNSFLISEAEKAIALEGQDLSPTSNKGGTNHE